MSSYAKETWPIIGQIYETKLSHGTEVVLVEEHEKRPAFLVSRPDSSSRP